MGLLPKDKSEINRNLSDQVILIYGRPKVGKSTLASNFEDAVFLATEPGLNHLSVYKTNIINWSTFLEACGEIAKGDHAFKTIVIDTIDNLVIYCSEFICNQYGIKHPGDLPMGKGWHLVTSELHRAMAKLASLPYGLVFVSHSVREKIETKTEKYDRWTISIGGKNKEVFLNMADMILFIDSIIDSEGERRVIRTKPSKNWEAGDKTGLLPDVIPLDFSKFIKPFKEGE